MLSREIYKLFKNNYFEKYQWTSASKYYLKRESTQLFSCEFCELLKNIYFLEDLQTASSETPLRESFFSEFCELFKKIYFLEDLQTAFSEKPVRGSFFNKVTSLTVWLTAWKRLTVLESDSRTVIFV